MKLAQYFVDEVSQIIVHPFADIFSKDIHHKFLIKIHSHGGTCLTGPRYLMHCFFSKALGHSGRSISFPSPTSSLQTHSSLSRAIKLITEISILSRPSNCNIDSGMNRYTSISDLLCRFHYLK